jgi:glutaredoxin
MKHSITIYTTAGCHLCEQAEAMFQYLAQSSEQIANTFSLDPIDIADDITLVEQFGVRIPVLVSGDRELGWPFELDELNQWLIDGQ